MFSKIVQKFIVFFLQFLFFPLVRLIWIKEVAGIENIPKSGPVILAFNHQSYFDFIGFMAVTPRPVYYLAAEKFYTKETHWLWKPILNVTGQVRVDRKSKDKSVVYKVVREILKDGKMLGIFPEGTRVPSIDTMQRGFVGVAQFAISNNVSIVPVGIKGAYDIMARTDKSPRFKKVLEFHLGEPISLSEYGGQIPSKKVLQDVTDLIMCEVARLSGKLYPYGK